MNQNDMDRYYWRTGQRWTGDYPRYKIKAAIPKWTIVLLFLSFVIAQLASFLGR